MRSGLEPSGGLQYGECKKKKKERERLHFLEKITSRNLNWW